MAELELTGADVGGVERRDSSLKRMVMFLRSVMPADAWQLIFLAGTLAVYLSPRLNWAPVKIIESATRLDPRFLDSSKFRREMVVTRLPLIFGGVVAYFSCFWPGPRIVRRLLWAVFLPIVLSLSLILFFIFRLTWNWESILEASSESKVFATWLAASYSLLPIGMYFTLAGFALLVVFCMRLYARSSVLPLTMGGTSPVTRDTEPWHRTQIVIFFLICPIFLFYQTVSAVVSSPGRFGVKYVSSFGYQLFADLLISVAIVALCVWIFGKPSIAEVWAVLRWPGLSYLAVGLVIPVGVSLIISGVPYLIDRIHWAAHDFRRLSPPQILFYFNASGLWHPYPYTWVFAAFAEEIVFRGLMLRRLMGRYGLHRGVFLTGLIWAAYHFYSDVRASSSASGELYELAWRISSSLAMNYVLVWLTLRCRSVIPAGIAHAISNIFIRAAVNPMEYWPHEFRVVLWFIVALLLYRFWPLVKNDDDVGAQPVGRTEFAT